LDFNEEQTNDANKINFAGAVIGNGCVNNTVQGTDEYIQFLHQENLIPADSHPKTQVSAATAMVKHLGYTPNYYDYRTESISCDACYGYNYSAWAHWFLKDEIEQSLNVCGDAGVDAFAGSAGGCISLPGFDADDTFDYSGALGRTLDSGVPVVLYYGKTDTACNYVGGLALADTISWASQAEFAAAGLGPMEIAGVEAGQAKSLNGLTFIQVNSAGHMVPLDQPASSAMAIGTILQEIKQKRKE
jgi:pimeloyl-ACP methyl ester carboxylesterase